MLKRSRLMDSWLALGAGFIALLAGARPAAADALATDKLQEPPLVMRPGAPPEEVDYLQKLHAHVHDRWTNNFLRLIGEKLPLTNPLNDPRRSAEVDVVISSGGQLVAATITRASGFPGFDDALMEVLRDGVTYPRPPESVRSDDDKLHVHWLFARDQRRCAGLHVLHVNDPLEVALPKLLRTGRRGEVVTRVAEARAAGIHAEPVMTQVARDWLRYSVHEPWTSVRMARIGAERGDTDAIAWLKLAVRRPETARDAGEALVASKVAVCPLVKATLDGQSWPDQQTAALALATSGDPACAPGLIRLLENTKARPEARVAAASALGNIDDEAARKSLLAIGKDAQQSPAVRGAALLAQIRPGAGRGKVLQMVTFLRDPSPDLRAAAAAGVVRAGGDANLADLYVLFKDNDARPSEATLRELDNLQTEESTKLIARLARRPQASVQKLAARLLIKRRARGSFPVMKSYIDDPQADPEVRGLALIAADEPTLAKLFNDPKMGIWVYRARLARGERDAAADWFVAHAPQMTPQAQGEAMADWALTADAGSAPTAATASADARKPKP